MRGPWGLPQGWRWERLGDVTGAPDRGFPCVRFPATFRYLDVSGIAGSRVDPRVVEAKDAPSRARQFVKPGDTVLSGVRVYLRNLALIGEDSVDVASTAFCVLSPGAKVDPGYLYRWIGGDAFVDRLIPLQRGNSPPAVLDDDVRDQFIPLPPTIQQQRQIVSRVNALFAEIDDGEAALADARAGVETYRKALLKAAITGELTADWRRDNPPTETGHDLLRRILTDRRARWKAEPENRHKKYTEPAGANADEFPELPEGWCLAAVETVGDVQLGRQRAPQHHAGDDMRPYLRVANVLEARLDLRDVKLMNFTPTEYDRFRLLPGDVLLNEGQAPDLIGRPALYRGEIAGCCFQKTLLRFRAWGPVAPEFALVVFRQYMRSGRFRKEARITTNIGHLTQVRFAPMEFPVPPWREQERIVGIVEAGEGVAADLPLSNLHAGELRQSILSAAFRGELVS